MIALNQEHEDSDNTPSNGVPENKKGPLREAVVCASRHNDRRRNHGRRPSYRILLAASGVFA